MNKLALPKRMRDEAMRQADAELRAQHYAGHFDEGDPNHPKYNNGINYTRCFGLPWNGIFAKQQKEQDK